jgi:hypothetical protein
MRRRSMLKYLATTVATQTDLLRWFTTQAAPTTAFSRVRPGMPDWPTEADWAILKRAVGDRLEAAGVRMSMTRRHANWFPILSISATTLPSHRIPAGWTPGNHHPALLWWPPRAPLT